MEFDDMPDESAYRMFQDLFYDKIGNKYVYSTESIRQKLLDKFCISSEKIDDIAVEIHLGKMPPKMREWLGEQPTIEKVQQ